MEDEALKALAEQIVEKMNKSLEPLVAVLEDLAETNEILNKSLEPLVAVLEDLAETNEILLGRIERLEFMLGVEEEPACTCPDCSKPPMPN